MSTHTATLSRLFADIEGDMRAVDALFRERAKANVTQLNAASFHILGSQGKRLRTAITLFAGKLIDYRREKLLPLSAGFEMLHLASLVHDDIIDHAATRRNLPTINATFGNSVALLLGDYYFAKTAGLIADVNDNRIDRLFSETVATIVEGTLMELLDAHHLDLSMERYLDRINHKTACLIAACCKGGATVCGASDEQIEQMNLFGEKLGLAFQIIDDILDYQGTEASIGKPAGNDLRQGMVTLPLIYALQSNANGHLAHVQGILEEPDKNPELVAEVVAWVNASNGNELALHDAHVYAQEARDILLSFPESLARDMLEDLIDFVLQRER
jgi:geranylgeranyl pyrophosphate synthase